MRRITFISTLLFTLSFACTINASLLISPTRINFDNRDRVAEVILINTGESPRTYRISWEEKKATRAGGYENISVEDPIVDALSPFVRFSPRQVRLAPGERQVVKLQLRKKADMLASEYRSHLLFTVMPLEEDEASSTTPQDGASFKINVLMNYSVPVLYHPQKGSLKVGASYVGIQKLDNKGADVNLLLDRNGDVSAFGRLELYATINGQKERIGVTNNVSVFKEIDQRIASVRIPNYSEIADQLDLVELKYLGEKEHIGKTLTHTSFNIN